MNKAWPIAAIACLLLAFTAPMALAEGDEAKARRAQDRRLPGEPGQGRQPFGITLNATGVDKDNRTYELVGLGAGVAKARKSDGNLTGFHGFARIHVKVFDENGSLIKEGNIRLMLAAHKNETGEWKWRLASVMRTSKGLPKLALHGDDVVIQGDTAVLEGQGSAVFKPDDADRRVRLRLDATVHLERL